METSRIISRSKGCFYKSEMFFDRRRNEWAALGTPCPSSSCARALGDWVTTQRLLKFPPELNVTVLSCLINLNCIGTTLWMMYDQGVRPPRISFHGDSPCLRSVASVPGQPWSSLAAVRILLELVWFLPVCVRKAHSTIHDRSFLFHSKPMACQPATLVCMTPWMKNWSLALRAGRRVTVRHMAMVLLGNRACFPVAEIPALLSQTHAT